LKKNTIIYPVIYKDHQGEIKTEIENSFDEIIALPLSLNLNGVHFQSSSFDDFELINPGKYDKNQLDRFTFNQVKVWESDEYVLVLCNYELKFEIPILLIDKLNNNLVSTNLFVNLKLGKPRPNNRGIDYENASFKIELNGETYSSEGDVFEDPLVEIEQQISNKYHFKNCFGCLYSDYSPYGNGFFGTMLCLRNCKAEYLKASSKPEWLDLMEKHSILVQETHCCSEFKERIKNTGYRG